MVNIKLAKLVDLDRVKEIAEACAEKMIKDNIYQWNENYPSKEIFREDIKNKALFVAKINSEISRQSICCSYKPYCRGIIKGGSVIDSFFFSDVPCKPYEENSKLSLEYPSFESFNLPYLYHL